MNNRELWDIDENKNFIIKKSPFDLIDYKVYDIGTDKDKEYAAFILSYIRFSVNKLLFYLIKNPHLWRDKPIAFGIYHTFDIHIPCWKNMTEVIINNKNYFILNEIINKECIKNNKLFNIQEMRYDQDMLIGLNKPKKIKTVRLNTDNGIVKYKIAETRAFFITLRNKKSGRLNNIKQIMDLVLHELTHTTCNDIIWKDDNHMYPYTNYHTLMRNWATDCNII